jgi:hypothetical protein
MLPPILRTAAAATLVFAAAACSNADATKPLTSTQLLLAADIVADQGAAATTTVQNALGAESITGAGSLLGLVVASSNPLAAAGPQQFGNRTCTGPDVDGWFTCTAQRENGFMMARQHRFFGAGGFQTVFGTTTDSAQYRWTLTGVDSLRANDRNHDTDDDDAVNHTRWVNEGDTASLVPVRTPGAEARIWNFRGAMNDSSLVVGPKGTRRFHIVASRVGKDITWKLPRLGNPWPVSGTLTTNYSAVAIFTDTLGKADTTARSGSMSVTFDGGKPEVPIGDQTLRCLLRLDTRRIRNCH